LLRTCFQKHIIEGRIEAIERQGRSFKQFLDDLKENIRYWELKEEALDRTVWITRFGSSYGEVVRHST
jgi:hypothetical protein